MCEYVIFVEDDILLAPDALLFFEHCREEYRHDKQVFTVSAYRRAIAPPEHYHRIIRQPWFTPWGWATWRDRFDDMSRRWDSVARVSWDCTVNTIRDKRLELVPLFSRSQNIGALGGTYCPGPEWHRQNQFNEYWAGMQGISLGVTTSFAEA